MVTLGIDFDGTIVRHAWPEIGEPMPGAFETLKDLKAAGYKLILWTCREDFGRLIDKQYLTEAVEFCRENGVEFDAVNESLKETEFRPENVLKRKPHCHYYIDDSNLGGFPGWDVVRQFLLGKPERKESENGDQVDKAGSKRTRNNRPKRKNRDGCANG